LLNLQSPIKMLASVTSVEEALIVLDAGVDMIDLKNPAEGALGALKRSLIEDIVRVIDRRSLVSATIGDLPMKPELVLDLSKAMVETGVDIVKIGFFGHFQHAECLEALKPLATKSKLIAVLFADESPSMDILPVIAQAGFYGVMLDTANKNGGHLLNHLDSHNINKFAFVAKELGLVTGLAGSIQATHIKQLSGAKPSYLGFRGALCHENQRVLGLDINKIHNIKNMLH